MKRDKYMGMDVHQATTVVAVIDAEGKIVLETIVPTAAAAIRRLIESISGPLHVTLEETTQAEWLHDLLLRQLAAAVQITANKVRLDIFGRANAVHYRLSGRQSALSFANIDRRPKPLIKAEHKS